jgi:type III pantothenate kinase
MSAFLVIDAGNTQSAFGLYENGKLAAHWRLSSGRYTTPDELAWQLYGLFEQEHRDPGRIDGIMAASVVPRLDRILTEACTRICGQEPAFVGSPEVKTGMAVDYKNPREVGADRIVNAIAAREAFGSPIIVIDCGTATTFDIVSPEGHYAGGLIMPGTEIALAALHERAAKLPEVSFARIDVLIGRDTATSMQAGSYWGAVESISGIIRRIRALPGYGEVTAIATGGLAAALAPDIPELHRVLPHLTLEGLRLLAERHFA